MIKLILFVSMISWAYSVPAYKGAIKFKQNDGSSFSGKLKGDEWFNWVEDKQGDIIKYNKESKNYEYGMIKEINGTLDLVPSSIKVGHKPKQSSNSGSTLPSLLKIDKKTLEKIWKQKKEKALKYKKH
ncbi:MAG: hypothetical protein KC427_03005 [Sulfurovum sp.]|uniref:hypothetical protein n=1 Tax=Sulfurovum sp. TaxID=1969726 RepID=UPI00286815BA|nr:hypothetical protein [Sulfurovum sp.]MCO4844967.1 hypothetical protein [Sulfurovum sp.]